jgi:acetolactate synthase-1/2/3 large subunit
LHEDIAVHLAQGYAKIAGKPMAMACRGVVGLQHAAMAIRGKAVGNYRG